jgi:hypothetical protein
MNPVILTKFTASVLRGAERSGVKRRDLEMLLNISVLELEEILRGSRKLSASQAGQIEEYTKKSVSELALLGIEAAASPEKRKENGRLIQESVELVEILRSSDACSDHESARSSPAAKQVRHDVHFPPRVQETLMSRMPFT